MQTSIPGFLIPVTTKSEVPEDAKVDNKKQHLAKQRILRTAKENRRYRLHQKLKKAQVKYNPTSMTMYVPFDVESQNKDIIELQMNYSYQIQFEI